jgi:hypothetical protein
MYLAIEKDEKIHKRESAAWLSHLNVSAIRVDSMNEGIEQARLLKGTRT